MYSFSYHSLKFLVWMQRIYRMFGKWREKPAVIRVRPPKALHDKITSKLKLKLLRRWLNLAPLLKKP